ncbi:MAG: polysaccharide deacetylase, partial [Caulobacteraceae bacterium]|nr:polysaccharide deacetylase [Caulobacteraceae bacterium]
MDELIFHDPTGRRARRLRLASGVLISLAAALAAAFFATLAFAPHLPSLQLKDPRALQALHVENAHHRLKGQRPWTRAPKPASAAHATVGRPLSVGFYVSWDESSLASLAEHVDELDVVSPQWVALTGEGGAVSVTADPHALGILAAAKRTPAVMPTVYNARESVWNGPQADRMLANPAARRNLIASLVELAHARGYAGYVFDLEDLSAAGAAAYPGFIAQARAALAPAGREVWVTAPFADDSWPLAKLQAAADALVLMAYDQHWGTGDAGPPAGQDWFQAKLASRMAMLDPARTVLALGDY